MELHVPRLPSIAIHHVFLIVTACCAFLFPCSLCLDAQYEYCQNSACGDINITYPFGVGSHGCGVSTLQMDCLQNSSPVLSSAIILEFYQNNNSFVVAKIDNCQFIDYPFHVEVGSANITVRLTRTYNWTLYEYNCASDAPVWLRTNSTGVGDGVGDVKKCNETLYYSLNETEYLIPGCGNVQLQQLTVNVAMYEWGFNDTKINETCTSCEASGGICGYDVTFSSATATAPFLCYCQDGPRTDNCLNYTSPYLESPHPISPDSPHPYLDSPHPISPDSPHPYLEDGKKAVRIGVVIGGSAAAVLIAAGLLLGVTLYSKRRKPPSSSSIAKVENFLEKYANEMPTRYSSSELKRITNNFVEKLGQGGFGVVYKGKLPNGTLVAVKLLDRHRHSESTEFMNEVGTTGRVHHVNLVRLLGYCFESFTSALVYEFMLNGSLEKFIFAGKMKGRVLRWEQLYSIALGTARGIAYLHHDCEKRIIHFDIKPHNILLDADFTPKVSDFGLAKLCGKEDDHISMTVARGTPGYVAPEVCDRDLGPVTDKSDVYSFGMLLLEIVGERKNFDWKVSRSSQFYFPEWAFKLLEIGELGMRLREGELEAEDEEKARRLTKVGLWCIQYNYRDRPDMNRVVQMLEGNGGDVANPPLPSNSSSAASEKPLPSSTEESCSIETRL